MTTATDERPDPRPWWDLSPATPQEAADRRNAMNENILDGERWLQRKRELQWQELQQQRQH